MQHLAQQFVEERKRRGLIGRGQRVPQDLRDLAIVFTQWWCDAGGRVADAAEELGVASTTLARWMEAQPLPSDVPQIREVVVREEAPPSSTGLTLITPDGFRIEGFEARQLARILAVLR